MTHKKPYIRPAIEVIDLLEEYNLLETISLNIGSGSASGGGDARGKDFDESEEANPWHAAESWGDAWR